MVSYCTQSKYTISTLNLQNRIYVLRVGNSDITRLLFNIPSDDPVRKDTVSLQDLEMWKSFVLRMLPSIQLIFGSAPPPERLPNTQGCLDPESRWRHAKNRTPSTTFFGGQTDYSGFRSWEAQSWSDGDLVRLMANIVIVNIEDKVNRKGVIVLFRE